MLSLVDSGASVLDLGCGRGSLLAELKLRGHQRVLGVEVAEEYILASARKGLNVIDHDLNTGLAAFRDNQFDVVVLSQTIQAITNTERVIDEMLRVGRRAIVCFPNFAYHKLRRMLFEEGRSPKSPGAYQFEWYDTPNRRFPTIADFDAFCQQKTIQIQKTVFLDSENRPDRHRRSQLERGYGDLCAEPLTAGALDKPRWLGYTQETVDPGGQQGPAVPPCLLSVERRRFVEIP